MKLKRPRQRLAPDESGLEAFRTVPGPHKSHAKHNYTAPLPLSKAQRAEQKRRRLEKHGPTPEFTPTAYMSDEERARLRGEVIRAARGRCQCCGKRGYLTLDHIVPRSLGGRQRGAPAFFVNNVRNLRTITPYTSVHFTPRSWRREALPRNQRHSVPRRRRL